MTPTRTRLRDAIIPGAGGGAGFWLANFAISLTPVAAEYRSALSIAYVPMLVEALAGGLVIGFGVSYSLLRLGERKSLRHPVLTSVVLGAIALALVSVLIAAPAAFLTPTGDPLRYFLIGTAFNAIRILALALAVGWVYGSGRVASPTTGSAGTADGRSSATQPRLARRAK